MRNPTTVPSIVIRAEWDDEAQVWVATNDDLGLATEADSLEALQAKAPSMIADLLEVDATRVKVEIDRRL